MGKLYTIDGKYLTGQPEIRLGDKVYTVDDRKKTVEKIVKISQSGKSDFEMMDEILKLAVGTAAFKEIADMDLSFSAYQKIFEVVMAAATGEEPEEVAARFQDAKTAAK